ncbi:hypothetical protein [Roseiarcus sp.]|uniref:hypothetical protein n=1 Tax=Roseiarcus sp. TaxID=1969460 RepID=UPI003F9A6869
MNFGRGGPMRLRMFALIAALGPLAVGSAPAVAGLAGAYVDTVSYFDVSDPPPGPTSVSASTPEPTPDCTTIHYCNILNYPIPGSSQNFPFPTVPSTSPLNYVLDSLSETYVSVSDNQITITNNLSAPFCFTSQCTGPFSGFGFYFSSGVDITKVTASGPSDFLPISGGLSCTPTSIIVNLNGDSPQVGDKLILDVYFSGSGPIALETSTWAMMLIGFAGLGFAAYRRTGVLARAV